MKNIKILAVIVLSVFAIFGIKQYRAEQAINDAEFLQTYGYERPTQSEKIKSDNWKGKYINISGDIDETLTYEISVDYFAQSDSSFCEEGFLFGPFRKGKFFNYKPIIADGKHRLTLPLDEVNPNAGCRYRMKYIEIQIFPAGHEKNSSVLSRTLFYNSGVVLNEPGWGFKEKQVNDVIDIECLMPDIITARHLPVCAQAPLIDEVAIRQEISSEFQDYQINIQKNL